MGHIEINLTSKNILGFGRLVLAIVFNICFFFALIASAGQQDVPADANNSWINGKWEGGPLQSGGWVELNLRVDGGDKVVGEASIFGSRCKGTQCRNPVEGKVKDMTIQLTVFWIGSNNAKTNYRLNFAGGALTGTAGKNFAVSFKKID